MPTSADDLIKRWEARNSGKLEEEAEARLKARVICFTQDVVLKGFLELAWLRTVAILQIPKDVAACIQPDFAHDADGRIRPALFFTKDVELPHEAKKIASLLGRFFKAMTIEWNHELQHVKDDEAAFQGLAEELSKKPEHPKLFRRRLEKWAN